MYDWANSAHSVVIITILPIFYNTVAGYTGDAASSMNTWGYCTSIAMLVIALMAPVMGVLGDFKGMRKKVVLLFSGDWSAFLWIFGGYTNAGFYQS